jgi:hypothetical protein
MHDYAI